MQARSQHFFFKKGMRGEGERGILIEDKKGKTFISYVIQVNIPDRKLQSSVRIP